jgi:hypothetical protein
MSRESTTQREPVDAADAARLESATHEAATATTTLIGAATNVSIKPSDRALQTQMVRCCCWCFLRCHSQSIL